MLSGMNDKVEISSHDVIVTQICLWGLTAIGVLFQVFLFFGDFNLYVLLIALATIAAFIFLHYHSFNFWNIWYENGYIHFKNLYREQSISVERFKKVETIGISRYQYGLYLDDNKVYPFSISQRDAFKLFFKMDPEHYAKVITAKLLEIKNERSRV